MTYTEKALAYCNDVISGEVPACAYIKSACQRHLDDLDNESESWQYLYDIAAAERPCKFIELLRHIKGDLARKKENLKLEPWQCFVVTSIFGWLHKETGLRRFSEVYIEVPRKNGKSTLISGIGLYMLAADNEEGSEVYCAAVDRQQASLVFNDAKRMAERAEGLKDGLGVETSAHSIHVFQTASTMKALCRESGGNLDGLNPHAALIDELHAHKTRDLYDVIESGMGARSQPLLLSITTAGFNTSGVCFEKRDFATKVLNKAIISDSLFTVIYTIDQEDLLEQKELFTNEDLWIKANPNWGVSVNPDFIRKQANKALVETKVRNNFLTKHLDVWTNTEASFIDMNKLALCVDTSLRVEDFAGEVAYKGTDLASKSDFADDVLLFPKIIDGETHIYCFAKHYLPEETVEESTNASYKGWADSGLIQITDGNIIDYEVITENFLQDDKDYDLRECGYDPYNANQFTTHLVAKGIRMVEVPQTVRYLSEPMKELEALILSGRFHYDGDPILTWMFSNVTCEPDKNDNIFPRKAKGQKQNKIDGVVAIITALNRYITAAEQTNVIDRFLSQAPVTINL
tara:strand:- start:11962 stop:13686 length:1725 start_codon:yes stop_codon:yes gene_type:complete